MPSEASGALHALLVSVTERSTAQPDMDLRAMRNMLDELQALSTEPHDVTYAEVDAGGVPAILATPLDAVGDRTIVYFHGGAYLGNTMHSHRKLAAHLAGAAAARALVVDFRRAPEHQHPAQIDDASAAYRWLTASQGVPASRVATAGDSAGGGLATLLALTLRDAGAAVPVGVVAFSPWFDLAATAPSLTEDAARDPFLNAGLLHGLAGMFLGAGTPADDPAVNVLRADLRGLPPLYLAAGADEGLRDDAARVAERARAAGVAVELEIAAGQQHVYPVMAGRAPEADATIARAGAWLRRRFDERSRVASASVSR